MGALIKTRAVFTVTAALSIEKTITDEKEREGGRCSNRPDVHFIELCAYMLRYFISMLLCVCSGCLLNYKHFHFPWVDFY